MIKYCFVFFSLCLVLTSCVTVSFHDYADTNIDEAAFYIKRLKEDTLVVVVPTYSDKVDLLKKASKSRNVNRKKIKKDLDELYEQQEQAFSSLWNAFKEHYTFSDYVFIPDTLIHSYENGENRPYFLNENGELDGNSKIIEEPIKFINMRDNYFEVKVGSKIVPNPFPNNVNAFTVFSFIVNPSLEKLSAKAAEKFNKRLFKYHQNPKSRVYY